jgi:uncharacterized HAD superfamily protein
MKPRLLLDIDGVLADFYKGLALFLNNNYNCNLDLDKEPGKYNIEDWGGGAEKVNFDQVVPHWMSEGGLLTLPVFDQADDFVKSLKSMSDVYIVTARIGDWQPKFPSNLESRVKEDTATWLFNNGIKPDNLFFEHNKIDFCLNNGISVMIEDKLSTALMGSKSGLHTVLMNRGYNDSPDRFRVYRVYNYPEALKQVRKLVERL